ncbi:GntR family transcriptional regulator [Xanthobacter sediminis]
MLNIEEANTAFITYREIKRRIVDLHYSAGERLSEARLSEELGVGRSPIRTALSRLRSEGWIAVSPQSGTYIRALTVREIREVTELRLLLEMHAAEAAALSMSDETLKALRAAFDTHAARIAGGDADAFIAVDNQLHAAIYDAAANSLVQQILLDLRDKVQWIRRVCAVSQERVQDGFHEVETVLAALERRDAPGAGRAMGEHVRSAAAFCAQLEDAGPQHPAS